VEAGLEAGEPAPQRERLAGQTPWMTGDATTLIPLNGDGWGLPGIGVMVKLALGFNDFFKGFAIQMPSLFREATIEREVIECPIL
jgi:hypothetical protein